MLVYVGNVVVGMTVVLVLLVVFLVVVVREVVVTGALVALGALVTSVVVDLEGLVVLVADSVVVLVV